MLFGTLIAWSEVKSTLKAVPDKFPPPPAATVARLVPGMRVSPARPGSMVNVIVAGTTPLDTWAIRTVPVLGTLIVNLPFPRLLIFSVPVATDGLHGSTERNTVVLAGSRIG